MHTFEEVSNTIRMTRAQLRGGAITRKMLDEMLTALLSDLRAIEAAYTACIVRSEHQAESIKRLRGDLAAREALLDRTHVDEHSYAHTHEYDAHARALAVLESPYTPARPEDVDRIITPSGPIRPIL